MAAPHTMSMENLSGRFIQNKNLSDNNDPILELQGISWLIRKAIGRANPQLTIKNTTDDAGATVFEVDITAAGTNKGGSNRLNLDWIPRPDVHGMFGQVEVKSRFYTSLEMAAPGQDEDCKFLNGEILSDGRPCGWLGGGRGDQQHVQTFMKSDKDGWTMEQTWGCEEIGGKKYHTRRSIVRKGDKVRRARLVYDFDGQ